MTQVCQSGREASECVIELNGDAHMHALLVQHILVSAFDKPEHHRSLFLARPPGLGFGVRS